VVGVAGLLGSGREELPYIVAGARGEGVTGSVAVGGMPLGEPSVERAKPEPTAGVDTSRIKTKAEKIDGGWLVNGQKVWTTNGQNARKILLLARTSPRTEDNPLDGMTLFFTDLDRTRITVREIDKLARPAVDSNELFIDNLEVRDGEVVGDVGKASATCSTASIPNAPWWAWRASASASAAPPWTWPRGTPTSASCSTAPSARTRRSRTRWLTRGCGWKRPS